MLKEKYVEGSFQTGMVNCSTCKVSIHALSPLKDKILTGIIEAEVFLRKKVVPRYVALYCSNNSRGLFYSSDTKTEIKKESPYEQRISKNL